MELGYGIQERAVCHVMSQVALLLYWGQCKNPWVPQNIDSPKEKSPHLFLRAEGWVQLFPGWCRTLVGSWNWNHVPQRAKCFAGFSDHVCHSVLRPTSHLHANHSRQDFHLPRPWHSWLSPGEFFVWQQQLSEHVIISSRLRYINIYADAWCICRENILHWVSFCFLFLKVSEVAFFFHAFFITKYFNWKFPSVWQAESVNLKVL